MSRAATNRSVSVGRLEQPKAVTARATKQYITILLATMIQKVLNSNILTILLIKNIAISVSYDKI